MIQGARRREAQCESSGGFLSIDTCDGKARSLAVNWFAEPASFSVRDLTVLRGLADEEKGNSYDPTQSVISTTSMMSGGRE